MPEQNEWLQYFENEKQKANNISNSLIKLIKELMLRVYKLYSLTEEEIRIVENG